MKNKKFWVSLISGIMAGIMILTLILSCLPVSAKAASSSEIKNQINELEKKNEELQKQINELEKKKKQNQTEMKEMAQQRSLLEQQISMLYEQIDNMADQIAAYTVLIADKQDELDEAQARLDELNEKNKIRIRAMEEDGDLSYWAVLFQANSFIDLLDRLNMIKEIAAADRRRLDEMSEAAQEVADAKAVMQAEKANLVASRDELDAKQADLEAKAEESQKLLNDMKAKDEEYTNLIEDGEDLISKTEEEIANAEVEYDKAKFQEWLATSVPPTTAPPTSGGNWGLGTGGTLNDVNGVTWVTPCSYKYVSSGFGPRTHPVTGEKGKMHNGVDLSTNGQHTPIYASRAGVVIVNRYQENGAGWYVTIDHGDGYRSVYMHMCKKSSVQVGQFVAAGEVIGCVGTTGASTGMHLHFGISYNGTYINPLPFIS